MSKPRPAAPAAAAASFLRHAKVVGLLTLASRMFGLVREVLSAHYLGAGTVASAFTVAFTVPNLFRKLFGEGALSAAFIPLYAQAVRDERARDAARAGGTAGAPPAANTPADPAATAAAAAAATPDTYPHADPAVLPEPLVVAAGADAVAADDRAERYLAASLLAADGPPATAAPVGDARAATPAAPATPGPTPANGPVSANEFAAAGVNLLVALLIGITLVGEAVLVAVMWWWPGGVRPDHLLTLRLAAIMLPYVVLVCGTAFLSGVLQVHRRFAAAAAAPILLNVCHIGVLVVGAWALGLAGRASGPAATAVGTVAAADIVAAADAAAEPLQVRLVYWLAGFVLVGGVLQVLALVPDLRAVGFRFAPAAGWWTPMTRAMLRLTVPVAVGAGVVQLSVLLDRGISTLLVQGVDAAGHAVTHFAVLGHVVRYPMEAGAPARLAIAQFLYLFPLGIFATALATAIFPALSADALDRDRTAFRASLRQGIEAALWEGIPASVGLILVCDPAVRLLFQHGRITPSHAGLIAQSLSVYAAAVWAFSLLQIVGRAYYAVRDTRTPLVMSAVNLAVNLAVELPVIWWLGEAGMAVGTLVAFSLQAVWMLWLLDRRVGGLGLAGIVPAVGKMVAATALMAAACWAARRVPGYPAGDTRPAWAAQVAIQVGLGGAVYVAACRAMRVTVMDQLLPRRFRRRG